MKQHPLPRKLLASCVIAALALLSCNHGPCIAPPSFRPLAMSGAAPHYLLFPDFEEGHLASSLAIVSKGASAAFSGMSPADGAVLPTLSEGPKAYMHMPRDRRIAYFADASSRKAMGKLGFHPMTVTLKWNSDLEDVSCFQVAVSEHAGMTDALVVNVEDAMELTLQNLKVNQSYYWRVTAVTPQANMASPVMSFRTEDETPRLLKIPNLWNVRDIGGRVGKDGRRVRQGMVYRSGGLNDNASDKPVLADDAYISAHPEMASKIALIEAKIKSVDKAIEDKEEIVSLPYLLSKTWAAFLPPVDRIPREQCDEFLALTEIPEEIFGARRQYLTAKLEDRVPRPHGGARREDFISFEGCRDYRPSLFMQQFDSDREGIMQIGCGADWFWALSANGKTIIDRIDDGNMKAPTTTDDYVLEIPVVVGRNTLCAVVLSGSAGWEWACGLPSAPRGHLELLKEKANLLRNSLDSAKTISRIRKTGRTVLTDEMKGYVSKSLGVKSEIDLRNDGECYGMTGSPAGPQVKWFHISSSCYGGMAYDWGRNAFADVFRVFLDEANYPIDFHCIAGQDRTGAVSCIILGLLGVEEDELYKDWEATGFWNPTVSFNHKNLFDNLIRVFDAYPGETINERIENYVLSLGFTREDIGRLRTIMLE